ncbi:YlzJ-like family protein [Neobacillus sp. LXY-4]|uniref:YlzJ-like family protein n=1 Tax=Neobacillus sp. LXY-4 TaxID=3379826 RepID=UPI003EE08813
MILYTMMPHELVFPVETYEDSQAKLITYQGVPIIVEKTEENQYRVVRIVSTDPQHYLNDRLCPGTKISF